MKPTAVPPSARASSDATSATVSTTVGARALLECSTSDERSAVAAAVALRDAASEADGDAAVGVSVE